MSNIATATALPAPATTLSGLNALNGGAFTATLADIFEHSPWVAERVASHRPFTSVAALHAAMCAAVRKASAAEQLTLLRAHPELAGRQAQQGELTASSEQEQSRAGLKALSSAEMTRIAELNATYLDRHGFPFIVCVGRHDKQSLFQTFERRAGNSPETERHEALSQVEDIARLRLEQMFAV